MAKIDQKQPRWICQPCGVTYGTRPKSCFCATFHVGTCGVCGDKGVYVTEPRDFGFLREGWKEEATRA
jgi:hypothetical protein